MKILILAGGTGSIALQTGLHDIVSKFDDVEVKVLVNAYDNGLSTGAVRKVFNGHILGPSDVRKNQTTIYKLKNPNPTPLSKFLDKRFTFRVEDVKNFCYKELEDIKEYLGPEKYSQILEGFNCYFAQPTSLRIDYSDFSISNIVYAGIAGRNGNSLRHAASVMADILGIEDNVILNDDTSLFLGAVTKSGKHITDEGDIVSWNNPDDPIVDVTFTDAYGEERMPMLCQEAKRAIYDADVIILSSGTQWSSLIPTYATLGFKDMIEESKAKVLMVMNRVPDKDAPNQSASDIIETLIPQYLPAKHIHLLIDECGHELMRQVTPNAEDLCLTTTFAEIGYYSDECRPPSTHHPERLARTIFKVIYQEYLHAKAYMFDYDDTLIGRGNSNLAASQFNTGAIIKLRNSDKHVAICSGNGIKAVKFNVPYNTYNLPLRIFADGGINEYLYSFEYHNEDEPAATRFVGCAEPNALLPEAGFNSPEFIISTLCSIGIPVSKIENRGNAVISIKPIDPDYRRIVASYIRTLFSYLNIRESGRTTIDISKQEVSKDAAVKKVLSEFGSVVFVGDEFESGNDASIKSLSKLDPRIKCLSVKSPSETALFLTALING